MNISKSKTGAYVCNYKEAHTYVLVDAMKDKKGSFIRIDSPTKPRFLKYEGASLLGAIEEWLHAHFNHELVGVMEAMHAKIGEDLGIDYDCRFTY